MLADMDGKMLFTPQCVRLASSKSLIIERNMHEKNASKGKLSAKEHRNFNSI
jgi:hypothetical protein